jgi:AraC-like DNA-binding protein
MSCSSVYGRRWSALPLSVNAAESAYDSGCQSTILYRSSGGFVLGFRDPIADAISLLRPQTTIGPNLRASGEWSLRFEPFPHVRIGGLVRGACWVSIEGHPPVRLNEGDTFLLGHPPSYTLSSDPAIDPVQASALTGTAVDGEVRIGAASEDEIYTCVGDIAFDHDTAALLTTLLPPLVVVRAADPDGVELGQLIRLLAAEVAVPAAGGPLVQSHLAQILLVHMLRAHVARTDVPTGWLGALGDDGVGAALRAMHADISHGWTLAELASVGHMSRSGFAEAFRRRVGTPPLDYLIRWRMNLARDALARDRMTIPDLARATGYRSESAFSTAFRRVVGVSPAQFRARARADTSTTAAREEAGAIGR